MSQWVVSQKVGQHTHEPAGQHTHEPAGQHTHELVSQRVCTPANGSTYTDKKFLITVPAHNFTEQLLPCGITYPHS